jgi:hypothetical protein
MSLLKITEFQFTKGNNFSINNGFVRAGLRSLDKKGMIRGEENERVVEIDELLLEMWKLRIEADEYCGNNNNPTGKTKKRKARKK